MRERSGCLLVANIFAPIQGGSATVYETLCRLAPVGTMAVLASRRHYGTGELIPGWHAHDAASTYPVQRLELLRPAIAPAPANKLVSAWRFATVDLPIRAKVLWTALSMIRRHRCGVICIGELNSGAWLGQMCRWLTGVRLVYYIHGEEITTRFAAGSFGRSRERLLQAADAVIAVSRFTAQALQEQMGVAAGRIELIANGVDTGRYGPGEVSEAFLRRHALQDKEVIVGVGRLVARKGFDRLIEAMPQILQKAPRAHLLIVGEGPQMAQLTDLTVQHGVAHAVTFAGSVSHDDLLSAYRCARVFAMPNRTLPDGDTEGFGLVFLEANACGRAVIGGRAGGAVEAVKEGVSGVLVDGNRVDEIANAVAALLNDAALRQRLEAGALAHAGQNTWQARAAQFAQMCARLSQQKRNA